MGGMEKYIKGATQISLALQVLMGAAFAWWWLFWFLQPIEKARNWLSELDPKMEGLFLGTRGSTWLLQVLPFMIIAVLSYAVIELRKRTRPSKSQTTQKKPKADYWNQPILLKSPLGMITLLDIIFIFTILFLVAWYLVKMSLDQERLISHTMQTNGAHSKGAQELDSVGYFLGMAALIPMALLWIPVSRSSPILRVTGIPFERAVKYHTWLGMLCVWLLTAHGITIIVYSVDVHQASKVLKWQTVGVAYLPGVIALGAGLLMLATALERVRRNHFNTFFMTHHLYIVFFVFFVFHCEFQMPYVEIPILLFFLDRFIRMVQSRTSVDVLSTRVLPSGSIELKFAKPENLEYNALSFIYVLMPNVSRFQWHPFSVASSPLDETNQICIYIKPLGDLTKDLHDALIDSKHHKDLGKFKCPFGFKLALEGPYGDESNFYLKYESLVLVAGGIGVTPFLAILRDLLYRYRRVQEDLPKSIDLVYCVKDYKDLYILNTLNPNDILPGNEGKVQMTIHAFVTSRAAANTTKLEVNNMDVIPYEEFSCNHLTEPPVNYHGPAPAVVRKMSALAGEGDTRWVAATVFATVVGYFVIWGIFNVTFIDVEYANYSMALLYCLTIALAVVGCGGGVMFSWAQIIRRRSPKFNSQVLANSMPPSPLREEETTGNDIEGALTSQQSPWLGEVTLGKRPNWKELFDNFAKQNSGKTVGVLVSGHQKMQEDVAAECKHHSLSNGSTAAFRYHSVSFEL